MPIFVESLRHRRAVLFCLALMVLFLLPGAMLLETDNSPEVFFVQDSQDLHNYHAFRKSFGSDHLIRLVISGPNVWTSAGLRWIREVEEKAEQLSGVKAVSGLYSHYRRAYREWPPDPQELREKALANTLDRNLGWVNRVNEKVTVLVALKTHGPTEEREALSRLRALSDEAPPGVVTRLTGLPVVNGILNDSSREILQYFFPLLLIFSLVLLALSFRNPEGVVLPLAFVAICELGLLSVMGYLGVRLNFVLAVLPPLLFVISLATAVHLLVGHREARQGLATHQAVVATYQDKGWAVFWTGVTTLVGFGSLALSQVGPVRSLGIWSAVGIAWMTVAAFAVYPALLATPFRRAVVKVPDRRLDSALGYWGRKWAEWAVRRRTAIGITALAIGFLALLGIPRLKIESNALHYLPAGHPARVDIEALESSGIGMGAVELILKQAGDPKAQGGGTIDFQEVDTLGRLSMLAVDLREEPLVFGAVGAGDLLDDAVRQVSANLTAAVRVVRQKVLEKILTEPEGRRQLARFLTPDGRSARITLLTPIVGYERLEPLLETVGAMARDSFPEAEVVVTGQYPLLLSVQRYLFKTLAVSLIVTLFAVSIIFYFILRSLRLTLLVLAPNLWPVAGVLGFMGWFQVPLDIATVMVAPVILGLAVDDTIHTLGHFRELAPRVGASEAVAATLQRTAPAYVITGLILAAGFGVCSLSDFAPTARFGSLAALGIVLAVLGDLFLLPVVLSGASLHRK